MNSWMRLSQLVAIIMLSMTCVVLYTQMNAYKSRYLNAETSLLNARNQTRVLVSLSANDAGSKLRLDDIAAKQVSGDSVTKQDIIVVNDKYLAKVVAQTDSINGMILRNSKSDKDRIHWADISSSTTPTTD